MIPEDLKFTSEHEWVREPGQADGSVRVGITDFAQDALGDIVFVQLPEVGETVTSGAVVGELESTKSVSEIYAPLGGEIVARNEALDATPELVNSDPYGDGWMIRVELNDKDDLKDLMDEEEYSEYVAQQKEEDDDDEDDEEEDDEEAEEEDEDKDKDK